MAKNPGGRPSNSSEEQLRDTLEALLAAGVTEDEITTTRVTQAFQEHHRIEGVPNAASLRSAIEVMLRRIKTDREDAWLAHVDESDDQQINEAISAIRRQLRLNVGRSRGRHKALAQEELHEHRSWMEEIEFRIEEQGRDLERKRQTIKAFAAKECAWNDERARQRDALHKLEMDCHALREQLKLLERIGISGKALSA